MKIPIPEDKLAENYVLGSCIQSIDALNHCIPLLDDADFNNADHKAIFQAMKDLYLKNVEVSTNTLTHKFIQDKTKISPAFLMEMLNSQWNGIDYAYYLEIIKNKSILRKTIFSCQQAIINASKDDANYVKIISEMQNSLLQCQGIGTEKSSTYHQIIQNYKQEKNFHDYYLWIEERKRKGLSPYEGVSSGFPILDHTLGTFQKGLLYYIGARTSMGKTTFMCNLIRNMMGYYKIGIFSLEMNATSIIGKIACILADIKNSNYEDGNLDIESVERLKEVLKGSQSFDVLIEDPSIISTHKLASRAKRMRNSGIEILFIDYLTRIQADGKYNSKHLMVDEVSKSLQNLAKELQIPIICFAQLNRASTGKEVPSLIDFRESGSIEEDADACLFIHRPSYYNPADHPGITKLIIAKNRMRGILKTIDYSCNSIKSEVYYELKEIEKEFEEKKDFLDGF